MDVALPLPPLLALVAVEALSNAVWVARPATREVPPWALGALMAWAILPVLQSSVLPADLIPPTIVTLDVRTLLGATLAVLAAAGIMGQLAMRSASAFRLNDELRALA